LQIGAIILVVIAVAALAYYLTRPKPKVPPLAELKIEDIKVGDGESPKMGQTVTVNYTGWLWKNGQQGKEFDSSSRHGRPIEFKLGGVIEGWNQGLSTMKVGGKRILYIPSKLAYGAMGRPPDIPSNSDLKFEVELLGVR
jgi:peptidylprolyl isomerase